MLPAPAACWSAGDDLNNAQALAALFGLPGRPTMRKRMPIMPQAKAELGLASGALMSCFRPDPDQWFGWIA